MCDRFTTAMEHAGVLALAVVVWLVPITKPCDKRDDHNSEASAQKKQQRGEPNRVQCRALMSGPGVGTPVANATALRRPAKSVAQPLRCCDQAIHRSPGAPSMVPVWAGASSFRNRAPRSFAALPDLDNKMSVRCIGDTWVMEQLGEKQDFESHLSRLGFRHEDFKLHVGEAQKSDGTSVGAGVYAVDLIHVITAKSKIYWGGRGANWVAGAADDLARGLFGAPAGHDVPVHRRSESR